MDYRCLRRGAHLLFFLFLACWFFIGTASPVRSEPCTKRIVFFGDSLTAGMGLSIDEAYPAEIDRIAEKAGYSFESANAGVSGDTTAGGLRRLDWVLKNPLDILVLALGANDGLRGLPLESSRENLEQIITRTKAKYPAVEILLVGLELPPNFGDEYTAQFRAMFDRVAASSGVKRGPFLLDGVAGDAALNQPDRIHPTAEGQKIMAKTVWRVLEGMVRRCR